MDQVKFVEDGLWEIRSKAIFHKFYLVHPFIKRGYLRNGDTEKELLEKCISNL